MKNGVLVVLFIIMSLDFVSCANENNINVLFECWIGKKMEIHTHNVEVINSIELKNNEQMFSIVNYIDSIGCIRCKSQLPDWKNFVDEIEQMFGDKVFVLIFMHPRRLVDAHYAIQKDSYPYPVCIDLNDEINKLNHFPDDDRFRCFLLDENNRVVLIGNPVQNPKIKDLYIRTICERLNINYSPKAENTLHKNLGVFSQSETKTVQFEIKNPDKKILKIDSVFTSCECTTAKIDKKEILQNESAVLTVIYKPDGIGDFYREIYVKIHNEEKPKIFEIEGKIE